MNILLIIFGACFFFLLLMLYAFYTANHVFLHQENFECVKLTEKLIILQISDLHLYGSMSKSRLKTMKRVVQEAMQHRIPDFVFLTGDLLDKNDGFECLCDILSLLKSKHGVFAVTGNHDYREYNFLHMFAPLIRAKSKPMEIGLLKSELKAAGAVLPDEQGVQKIVNKTKINIYGIDAMKHKKPEFKKKCDDKCLNILLSHYPDVLLYTDTDFDFTFSGHTHAGQITLFGWPLMTRSKMPRKHISGFSYFQNKKLYVSSGAGVSHYFPFRLFSRPHIDKIILSPV